MRLETLPISLIDIQIIAPGSVRVVNKNPSFITQYKQYTFLQCESAYEQLDSA